MQTHPIPRRAIPTPSVLHGSYESKIHMFFCQFYQKVTSKSGLKREQLQRWRRCRRRIGLAAGEGAQPGTGVRGTHQKTPEPSDAWRWELAVVRPVPVPSPPPWEESASRHTAPFLQGLETQGLCTRRSRASAGGRKVAAKRSHLLGLARHAAGGRGRAHAAKITPCARIHVRKAYKALQVRRTRAF